MVPESTVERAQIRIRDTVLGIRVVDRYEPPPDLVGYGLSRQNGPERVVSAGPIIDRHVGPDYREEVLAPPCPDEQVVRPIRVVHDRDKRIV
jgi:hypothetical protein